MIREAVIVVAELGSRLKDMTKRRPGGFFELDWTYSVETNEGLLLPSPFSLGKGVPVKKPTS